MKMEQDPRFKHLEALVGIFVVAALIVAATSTVYFGTDFGLFEKKYDIYFESDTGTGLTKGMPIKISGFLVGRVHDVSLNDKAKVIVQIRISRKYTRWIRDDSVATLMQEGLIGTSIIDISVGSPSLPTIKKEQFINFRKQEALNDIAMGMRDSVNILLNEIHKTIYYINDPQGEIKKTLANIERLTAGFEETRGKADSLILAGVDDAERAALLIDNLTAIAGNISAVLDNTSYRIPILLDKVEETLSNVENISMQVRNMAEQTAPRISPILLETEELVSNTSDVMGGVKKMWPLRNHIPAESKPGIVPGDSHE
ncbi:MAG: MlaD family protein [Syntrophorhabdaceae bacterium]|nr:MlaD family protein [Syntrophorhabdaceae bacterium]